jgi:hypothetical protein
MWQVEGKFEQCGQDGALMLLLLLLLLQWRRWQQQQMLEWRWLL